MDSFRDTLKTPSNKLRIALFDEPISSFVLLPGEEAAESDFELERGAFSQVVEIDILKHECGRQVIALINAIEDYAGQKKEFSDLMRVIADSVREALDKSE